jgi:transcription elongation GreA/GreB family factor
MNKRALIKKIIAHLVGELDVYIKAAHAAHAEATHEQSKAENKYDTRGLEASYLAHGQSRQAAEIEAAIEDFQKLQVRSWLANEPIELGALVELEDTVGERSLYLVAPRAGGTEVTLQKREILVITPQSPLGRQLIGRKQGEKLHLAVGVGFQSQTIVAVF